METQNLNLSQEMADSQNDSKKKSSNKTIGNAAQFVSGAAMGVVGAMAVNAFSSEAEEVTVPEEVSYGSQESGSGNGTENSEVISGPDSDTEAEGVTEINPNDISLESIQEAQVGDNLSEPVENNISTPEVDNMISGMEDDITMSSVEDVADLTIDEPEVDAEFSMDAMGDITYDSGADFNPDIFDDII
ncbi:MAG: hypothetical protein HDS07_02550 [Bacteroides sp.]|nr:hypothetical protein [Bacteroides sp.]